MNNSSTLVPGGQLTVAQLITEFSGGGGFSTEGQAAIDKFTGLTDPQQSALNTFINSQVTSGNHPLIKFLHTYRWGTEANALISMIGTKTQTNNGATHGATGFTFDGTNDYIESNVTPSTDLSGQQDNLLVGAGVVSTNEVNNRYIFGGFGTGDIGILENTTPRYGWTINRDSLKNSNSALGAGFINVRREGSTDSCIEIDGVQLDINTGASSALSDGEIFIGARNSGGGSPSLYYDGVIDSFLVAEGVGFDLPNFLTNWNIFQAAI